MVECTSLENQHQEASASLRLYVYAYQPFVCRLRADSPKALFPNGSH
ncbi:MAG: hypothetical protein VX780_02510 [Pseudomonadota bacterium]|nr:hypothetical protein [Pseudomonadota bacterium]